MQKNSYKINIKNFDTLSKIMNVKTKNKQMGLKKILHSKGNHKQKEKTTLKIRDDIRNKATDKIYKQRMKLNIKK